MPPHFTVNNTEILIDSLATQGFAVVPNFITAEQVQQLATRARTLQQLELLSPAATGKNMHLNTALRGDATRWLEDDSSDPVEQVYLSLMQVLQHDLNRSLYLGLQSFESHFAIYPVGAFYKKHLDQFNNDHFKQDDLRQVSSILYLNEAWQASDGGALRIYLDNGHDKKFLDISPIGGVLVVFMSSRFYHEVLPAKRDRISLAGWFKTRANVAF
ncbi:MAG: 2OG-Fe(II) oxygenase [Methylophilaceae bacterium]